MQNFEKNRTFAPPDTILIVEDDYISSLLLQEYLKMENFRILTAKNGAVAVSVVQKNVNNISLILMDILMPNMDGSEAAKEIKKITKNIPIIAQTSQIYNLKNYDLSFFDDIIIKPVNFRKLKELFYFYLEQSNSTSEISTL